MPCRFIGRRGNRVFGVAGAASVAGTSGVEPQGVRGCLRAFFTRKVRSFGQARFYLGVGVFGEAEPRATLRVALKAAVSAHYKAICREPAKKPHSLPAVCFYLPTPPLSAPSARAAPPNLPPCPFLYFRLLFDR